ncbi:MAG: 5-formyltetrahydrofolate cyclo-ligase [Candidatus Nanopelagicaceae bacterium]
MSSPVSKEKQDLRTRFRFERSQRSIGGDWLHLLRASEISTSRSIASYLSYGDEPSTVLLNEKIVSLGKILLLPRTNRHGGISWIKWHPNMEYERDKKRKNLMQPIGDEFEGSLDVVILPALRVDRSGVRLGQGGGSYDRALAKDNSAAKSWKVALLHDEELSSESLPRESHDVLIDAVALPEILVRFKATDR